jgi:hypothetical protein
MDLISRETLRCKMWAHLLVAHDFTKDMRVSILPRWPLLLKSTVRIFKTIASTILGFVFYLQCTRGVL